MSTPDAGGQVVAVHHQLHHPGREEVLGGQRPALPGDEDGVGVARCARAGRAARPPTRGRARARRRGRPCAASLSPSRIDDVGLVVGPGLDPGRARVVLLQRDRRVRRSGVGLQAAHGVAGLLEQVVGQPADGHARAGALAVPGVAHLGRERPARGTGRRRRGRRQRARLGSRADPNRRHRRVLARAVASAGRRPPREVGGTPPRRRAKRSRSHAAYRSRGRKASIITRCGQNAMVMAP